MDTEDKVATRINTVTEPGFLFNGGNAPISFLSSTPAGFINVGAGILCFAVRLCYELQTRGVNLPLPRLLQKLVNNQSAALGVNGALLVASSVAASLKIDTAHPETFVTPAMLACFGSGNIIEPFAWAAEPSSAKKTLLNAYSQLAYAVGMYLAAADSPATIKMIYGASFVSGILFPLMGKKAIGPISPIRITAMGSFLCAATNTNPVFIWANALFGIAYLGVDAGVRLGGFAAMLGLDRKAAKRAEAQMPSSSLAPAPEQI